MKIQVLSILFLVSFLFSTVLSTERSLYAGEIVSALTRAAPRVEWASDNPGQRAQKHALFNVMMKLYDVVSDPSLKATLTPYRDEANRVMNNSYKNPGQHRDVMAQTYDRMVAAIAQWGGVPVPHPDQYNVNNPSYGKVYGGWMHSQIVNDLVGMGIRFIFS